MTYKMMYRGVAIDPQIYTRVQPAARVEQAHYRGAEYHYPEKLVSVPVHYELEYRGDHWSFDGSIVSPVS